MSMTRAVKFAARPIPLNGSGLPAESYRLWVDGELIEWDARTGEVRTVVSAEAADHHQQQLASAR
jgi:hypothetical protein